MCSREDNDIILNVYNFKCLSCCSFHLIQFHLSQAFQQVPLDHNYHKHETVNIIKGTPILLCKVTLWYTYVALTLSLFQRIMDTMLQDILCCLNIIW